MHNIQEGEDMTRFEVGKGYSANNGSEIFVTKRTENRLWAESWDGPGRQWATLFKGAKA